MANASGSLFPVAPGDGRALDWHHFLNDTERRAGQRDLRGQLGGRPNHGDRCGRGGYNNRYRKKQVLVFQSRPCFVG